MRKKTLLLALLAPLALGLSSCVYDIDPGYGGGGYSTVSSVGYGHSPSRYSYGGYGLPWGVGGGYRHRYYCDRCRSHSCRCGHHDDHKKKSSSSSDLKHRENSYRITGGSTGSKKKPTGYHSIGWYESRGYDTSHLRLEDERGNRYGSSSSSKSKSSSSSSRSSSSSSSRSSSSKSSSKSSSSKSSGGSSKSSSSKSSGGNGRTDSRSSGSKGRSRG